MLARDLYLAYRTSAIFSFKEKDTLWSHFEPLASCHILPEISSGKERTRSGYHFAGAQVHKAQGLSKKSKKAASGRSSSVVSSAAATTGKITLTAVLYFGSEGYRSSAVAEQPL